MYMANYPTVLKKNEVVLQLNYLGDTLRKKPYRTARFYLCKIQRSIQRHGGFPGSSVGKESTCNAANTGSIPGSGRSVKEGVGYPLQYSWASFMAQLVKNLPAMQET